MLTYEKVQDIVANGRWNDLLGEIEGEFLDCKQKIYDLSSEEQKIEIAKDVTSFANAYGGFIILGVATQKSQTHFSDEISTLKPFESKIFDTNQHHNVLKSWVYPKLDDVRIEWIPNGPGSDRGFGIITIPSQPAKKKPFLISKTVLTSGRRCELIFGYAERKRDTSEPTSLVEIQQLLRDGLNYQGEVSERLDAIEAHLAPDKEPQTSLFTQEEISSRVEKVLAASGLNKRKHFVLTAYPNVPIEIPNLFSSKADSIGRKLEHPPVLRKGGFSLETGNHSSIIEGELRRVKSGSRKIADLYHDSVLIFACAADGGFLGWGNSGDDFDNRLKINTFVLTEVTYLFCLLYTEVLKELSNKPEKIVFRFDFGNMHSGEDKPPVYLVPYPVGTWGYSDEDEKYPAPKGSVSQKIEIPTSEFEPGSAAYKIIKRIYLWFGVGADSLPYSDEIDGRNFINPEFIVGK